MKSIVIVLMVIIIGFLTSQQGISGTVIARQGGKIYKGWVDDKGNVVIMNDYDKIIMFGHITKYNGIEIIDNKNGDTYQGRVSGFGDSVLHSRSGGSTLRIQLER